MSGNMNPNASQFSPSALAMVKHGDAAKPSDLEDCPRDLIVHESIKQLVQEVQKLNLRATKLEDENGHLKQENSDVKRELGSLKKAFASGSTAPAVVADLTGYAASDCSSPDVAATGSDIASLTKRVDEHQNTVNSILEKFKEYLMAEVSKRDKLEKQVNQFQYTLKEVNGRVGVLEPKFKAMLGDMDKLETDVDEIRNDNSFMSATTKGDSGPTSFFQDQIERLGSSVQAAMKKLKELEGDVDMHRMVINKLNEKTNKSDDLKSEHGWPVVQPVQGDGWATSNGNNDGWVASSSNGDGKAVDRGEALDIVRLDTKLRELERELELLRQTQDNVTEEKRAIDNCPTHEALYEKYHSYSKEIEESVVGSAYGYHVWAMRDRVLCRLVFFDDYGKAIQEARTADIGL